MKFGQGSLTLLFMMDMEGINARISLKTTYINTYVFIVVNFIKIFKEEIFINNPRQAIINGFQACENQFTINMKAKKNFNTECERSGTCAIVVIIVGR